DDSDDVEEVDGKKSKWILWDSNSAWTLSVIEYLTDNPNFRCKLFSDSTREAKESGQKKNQDKDGKSQMHLVLAAEVFGKSTDLDLLNHYTLNPTKYGKSVGQHLARLVLRYQMLGLCLNTYGNYITDVICHDFPFWDDLHAFWCELPNYNPIAVTNSEAGGERDVEAL
ncbi:hypothetical protein M422DRAFT_92853, partial [Sphaerobolus stellatus SS14]